MVVRLFNKQLAKWLTGVALLLVVILLGIVSVHHMKDGTTQNHSQLFQQSELAAFQTMKREFRQQTGTGAHLVYYSGMVTARLIGAETVQILGDNHKVYNVTVNRSGHILVIRCATS